MRLNLAAGALLLALPASAQNAVRPDDRTAIEACLQKQTDAPERCIGTVNSACEGEPGPDSGTTRAVALCGRRELLVWQEMVEASVARLKTGPLGTMKLQRPGEGLGADIIADMERTFVIWRAKLCDTFAMQYEGGTASRVLYGDCVYKETGRHALWLKALEADAALR